MKLFSIYPSCTSATLCQVRPVSGTMIKIDQCCGICGFQRSWNSQEMIGSLPSGNLSMSAAILFSGTLYSFISLQNCYNHNLIINVCITIFLHIGLIPSKAIRFLKHMNVASIALSTFHQHQKYYLHPAVSTMWKDFQNNYFDLKTQQGDSLVLGGDGRADTPGHSAKYGSYAMLDMDLMLVIDIQLVQV